MKLALPLVCCCLVFATALHAQLPMTSGSNSNPLLENSTDDLRAAIVLYPYTWGNEMIGFKANGTAAVKNVKFKWHVINGQEIDLSKDGDEYGAPRIHLKFSKDYETYSGLDFDGTHPLNGARVLPGQMATASPSPTAIKPNANTTADLNKSLIGTSFSWERAGTYGEHIKFNADGTGRHIDPIKPDWEFRWRATSAQEIAIEVDDEDRKIKGSAVLKFSDDYSTYTGTDLDGLRPVHGNRETTAAAAGVAGAPTPAAVAGGASPAKANPFMVNTVEDLRKAIVVRSYTWEHEGIYGEFIKFDADGTGHHINRDSPDWAFRWRVKNGQEVEIFAKDDNQNPATLKFNADYSGYEGTDFYGTRPIKGSRITADPK